MTTAESSPLDDAMLRRTIAGVLEVDVADVTDDVDFVDDLGVDSLLALEVLVELERVYGVRFDESELRQMTTFSTVRRLVARRLDDRP